MKTPTAKPDLPAHQGPLDWRRLLQWLREDGVISEAEAQRTEARIGSAHSAQHPLQRLAVVGMARAADGHVLDAETLTQWLAQRSGLDYLRIDPLKVDVGKVADVMSAAYAERHRVLPVQVSPTEVVVATGEPFVRDWVGEVERQTRKTVRLVLASPADIARYTGEFFALAKSVRAANKSGGGGGLQSFEQLVELGKTNKQLDANDQGVVQVVDWLWQYAFDQRASDIHLEPRRDQGVIRFRIDGVLHPVYQMPIGVMNAMTARIKLLGRMDVVERRRPQDGRIKTLKPASGGAKGDEVEMRLSTLPTAFGEKLVMRIFDPESTVKDLSALGFAAHDAQRWEALTRRPHGIVLVTGPTGSGKTTTLYATLKRLATAEMAVQAALTGHLVFSTLHTNDAPSAVMRLMELGIPPYLISATVLGVLAQRLVRTLCPACKQPLDKDDIASSREQLADIVKPWQISGGYRPYQPVGCIDCRMTGYRGRMGLYELLCVTEAFKDKVSREPKMEALRAQGIADGMRPLRLAGAARVAEGLTTLDEVLAATPPLA